MISISLVCPFDEKLLSSFSNQTLVVTVDDPGLLAKVSERVRCTDNRTETIRVMWDKPLSALVPRVEWEDISFVVYSPSFGEFRKLLENKEGLAKLDARFFLSTDDPETPVSLKILSSLGLDCGIFFGAKPPDWDALNDLMHYAYYGRAPHSSIEPFSTLAALYDVSSITVFDTVYYDNSARYLHMDKDQNIALTAAALSRGEYVGKGVENVPQVLAGEEYAGFSKTWQNHMLARDTCSFCPSFRLCAGRFIETIDTASGCREFFQDLVTGIEFVQKAAKTRSGAQAAPQNRDR
jgi:hypothetical protein